MENLSEEDVLPKLSEIPEKTLGFINNQDFNPLKNPSKYEDLAIELTTKCTHLQTHLQNLHTTLGSLLVSSTSRSIHTKSSLEDFCLSLENLSIISSHCGNRAQQRRSEKIVGIDLPYIATELQRIENIREYAGVALKLETLVGDLEDAVLSALNRRAGYIFSRTDPSPSIPGDLQDFNAKLDNSHKAVKAVNSIEELLLGVLKDHPQWRKLLKTVDGRVDKTLGVLRPHLIADHRSLLTSLGWPPKTLTSNTQNGEATGIPNPLILMQGEKKQSYSQSFLALCALQHVQLKREERYHILSRKKMEETRGLWGIDELVSPLASKIEYHLLKWVDQPEFMFALIHKIVRDFIEGVDDVLQPLIDEARLVSCSAKEAWVSSMVRVLSGFLSRKVFPVLAERYNEKDSKPIAISSWLHLIDEIVRFDKQMLSFISLDTYLLPGSARSMSALSLFCDRPDWLHIWAKVELRDAWKKLKAELKDERAWSPDHKLEGEEKNHYVLSTREDFKAPLAADFALTKVWEMIQRCQTLPGSARRIQFMKSAPCKFLWHFFKILLSRRKSADFLAYDAEENVVEVCRLINAARFSESKLKEWSDDVDLLELRLAEKGLNIDSTLDASQSCFFEEEIESLIEMGTTWVMELITRALQQFENYSSYYFLNMDQFEQVTERDVTISDDLVEALDNLRSLLLLLKEHLNADDFSDTWRSIANGLDHYIFRSFLCIGVRFSVKGAEKVIADMQGLFCAFKAFCVRPEAFFPSIRDLLKVLNLGSKEVEDLKSNLPDPGRYSDYLLTYGISSLSVDQTLQILSKRAILV